MIGRLPATFAKVMAVCADCPIGINVAIQDLTPGSAWAIAGRRISMSSKDAMQALSQVVEIAAIAIFPAMRVNAWWPPAANVAIQDLTPGSVVAIQDLTPGSPYKT